MEHCGSQSLAATPLPEMVLGPSSSVGKGGSERLGREEAAPGCHFSAHAGGPGSSGGRSRGQVRKEGPRVSPEEPFTQVTRSEPGRSWAQENPAGPVWAQNKGPTPERNLNSNFLPGFEASVNFLLFLFGSKFRSVLAHGICGHAEGLASRRRSNI